MEMVQAMGRRLQSLEMSTKNNSSEPSEQVLGIVKKLQTTVSARFENLANIEEEMMMAKIQSVQQRIVETTNSYHSLTKEIAASKLPEGNDDMRALKILQYHSRIQGIRHRLTHLDSEHMVETDRFGAMKTELELMEKREQRTSAALNEIFGSIQDKVDMCVTLNKDLWDQLMSIDKAAGNAWGKVARLIAGGSATTVKSFEDSRRLSIVTSAESKEGQGESPVRESREEEETSADMDSKIEGMIKSVIDLQLEKLEITKGGKTEKEKINSDALKAVDEKLEVTKKMMEDLLEQNNLLKSQILDKADAADIQSALRASRMVQSQVENKADLAALESMETFLHKCRKEVVKLRSSQEAGISSTRRILERKLKKIMKETVQLREMGSQSATAFIGTGQVSLSPRGGAVEKGVTWKSDKSKFVPSQPAVSKGGGVIVTKGNFLMSMPAGVRGRPRVGEDPPRSGTYTPVSESLGKMFVDTTSGRGVAVVGSAEVKLPKAAQTKPSRLVKNREGGLFWGDAEVQVPPKPKA